MYDQTALLADLETSLTNRSDSWRASALKQLTMLFVAGAGEFSDQHIALYDLILPRFIDSVDQRTLVEISTVLSKLQNGPPVTTERLALHTNVAIAGPVLERSEALSDAFLVKLILSCDADRLLVIVRRAKLSADVSDAILEKQNRTVNRHLVANEGAQISEMGFVKMMDEAQRDSVLATSIRARTDIPMELRPFFEMSDKSAA